MSVCYAIASGKGGVGKSALTANLAAALAQAGKRVAVVDADIGLRSQDALLGLENRVVYDLVDLAKGDCALDQALLESGEIPSLYLLPAAQFSRVKELDPKKFRKIIRALRLQFDLILIDCPAGIERGFRNVLNAGPDYVLLVVTPDDISLRSAERAVQTVDAKELPRPLLIVNRLDSCLISARDMMSARTAAEVLDLQLIGEIPEDPAFYRSQLRHELMIRQECEARQAVLRVASRLLGNTVDFPSYGQELPVRRRRILPLFTKEVTPIDDY